MAMPEEFKRFAELVIHVLDDFESQEESSLRHVLVKDVEGFHDWRGTVNADIHLCPLSSSSELAFNSRVARDIFPLILSSILMTRLHWMTDEASLNPQTSELIHVVPHEKLQKRNVQYWLGNITDSLISLCEPFPEIL